MELRVPMYLEGTSEYDLCEPRHEFKHSDDQFGTGATDFYQCPLPPSWRKSVVVVVVVVAVVLFFLYVNKFFRKDINAVRRQNPMA